MRYYHDLFNDKFFNEIIFKNKVNGYFVEIGALDGVMHSQSYFFEKHKNWDGIIVEPNENYKDILKDNRICNISYDAISNKNGKEVFCIKKEQAYSSIKSFVRDGEYSDTLREIEVNTITMVDLLKKFKSPKNIDFVTIDVEGIELEILKNFLNTNQKYSISIFAIETHLVDDLKKTFDKTNYIKIQNPFLRFLKHHPAHGFIHFNRKNGTLEDVFGNLVERNYDDFTDINFEHYYIDLNFLAKNPSLKKYIKNE